MDPAEGSSAEQTPAPRTILLHVLSVSTGIPDKLTFPGLPVSTTIGGLKARIRDAVVTKPPAGRQRLIYRGKALGQQDMTLETLFGSETIENSESLTLHLVVTPLPNSTSPTPTMPASSPQTYPHQPAGLPHLPRSRSPQIPRPFSTGQIPPGHPNNTQVPPQAIPMNNPWQPHPFMQAVPNLLNNHFAAFGQMQHPLAGPMQAHAYPNPGLHPTQLFPLGVQVGAQQQNNRPVPGQPITQTLQNGQNYNSPTIEPPSTPGTQSPHLQRPITPSFPPTPGHPSTTIVREGQTPGTQWRVVINQTVIPMSHNNSQQAQSSSVPNSGGTGTGQAQRQTQEEQRQQATTQAQVPLPGVPIDGSQQRNGGLSNSSTSQNSMVYLLSSPTGPEALLISPSGTYASPGFHILPNPDILGRSLNAPFTFLHQGLSPQVNLANPVGQANQPNQINQPTGLPEGMNAEIPPQPDQPQEVRQDQAADLLRILLQNGGTLWLLVRLCGFLYLFTNGVGWYRTTLIVICTIIVFVAQAGWFRPLLEIVGTPIRRHVEGLLRVEQRDGNAGRMGATGQGDTNNLTPQQLAERLGRERDEREMPLFEIMIRRFERAVMLFMASLIPGVGEQHVAAREAVARQERERQEAAQREEEERRRVAEEQSNDPVVEGESASSADTAGNVGPAESASAQEAVMTGAS